MDVDNPPLQQSTLPPSQGASAFPVRVGDSSSSASNADYTPDVATGATKRKYEDLLRLDVASQPVASASSSPTHASSPLPPSSPLRADRSSSSTPAPPFTSEAQKVYIARTAPHLLGRASTPSTATTPSVPPSGRSSPSSDDGRSTPDGATSTPTPSNQSHHTLPEGYRGPALRRNDAEDFAPPPHLVPTIGSATLFNTINHAVNRNGWRYNAAGPASQHLPQTMFKTLETRPAKVHWCWSDRSPFTKISADAHIVATDKGFRSARTNIGVRQGEWYAEIEILPPEHLSAGLGAAGPLPAPMKDGAHIRLGWGRREAPLNAPVGFDGYSYGFRDKTGDKVTLSRPLPYGTPFKPGDVVGLYIKLPPHRPPDDEDDPANIKRERIAIRYKGQLYFESLEYPRTREMEQLMERSRKGNSIEEALRGIEGTGVFEPAETSQPAAMGGDGANGTNATAGATGNGTAGTAGSGGGSGSAKVKNRKTPGTKEKASGPAMPSLRPVPILEGSKIGFFVNGQPQGIAFRDLFDFRPLRVKGFTGLKPAPPKASTSRPAKQKATQTSEAVQPVINVKARENVFDDGALGYFPFVSSYGGARAKLITGEHGFRFPPPDDIEAALESVTAASPSLSSLAKEEGADVGHGRKWKPLCARFEEHLAEMWTYDLQDEAKAQALADKQAEEKARRNNAAKERYAAAKKKHAAALARNASASPAPLLDPRAEAEGGHTDAETEADADRTVTATKEDHEMDVEVAGPILQTAAVGIAGWEASEESNALGTPSLQEYGDAQTPSQAYQSQQAGRASSHNASLSVDVATEPESEEKHGLTHPPSHHAGQGQQERQDDDVEMHPASTSASRH